MAVTILGQQILGLIKLMYIAANLFVKKEEK